MELALFWFGFAILCGLMAGKAGRSGFGYFVLAILISPLLCFLLLVIIGSAKNKDEPSAETHIKCPDCRELVLKDARVCKHCGCKLIPQQT